jgi:hypothetical protein
MAADYCPTSPSGKHTLAGTFATVSYKAEFEPVQYGKKAEDTLYRRVEYILTTCQCSYSQKRKIKVIDYNTEDE